MHGADGEFAEGAPEAAEGGAFGDAHARGLAAALGEFAEVGAGEGADGAAQEGGGHRADQRDGQSGRGAEDASGDAADER